MPVVSVTVTYLKVLVNRLPRHFVPRNDVLGHHGIVQFLGMTCWVSWNDVLGQFDVRPFCWTV